MVLRLMDGMLGTALAGKSSGGSPPVASDSPSGIAVPAQNARAYTLSPALAEIFVSARMKWAPGGALTPAEMFIQLYALPTVHLTIGRDANRKMTVLLGFESSTTVLAVGTQTVIDDRWTHIQVRATIANTGGICQVKVDDVLDIDFTGDTRNGGSTTDVGYVLVGGADPDSQLTDVVIVDTTGAEHNSWMGDLMVQALYPNGNGDVSDGINNVTSNNVNNYSYVDEIYNPTGDYVTFTTDGTGDTYQMQNLKPGTSSVVAVQTVMTALRTSGTKNALPRTRISGTTYTGPSVALTSSKVDYANPALLSPATGVAWTPAEVDSAQFGAQAGSGAASVRLYSFGVEVLTPLPVVVATADVSTPCTVSAALSVTNFPAAPEPTVDLEPLHDFEEPKPARRLTYGDPVIVDGRVTNDWGPE